MFALNLLSQNVVGGLMKFKTLYLGCEWNKFGEAFIKHIKDILNQAKHVCLSQQRHQTFPAIFAFQIQSTLVILEMYFFSLFAAKVAIISFEILELNCSGCFCAFPQRQQSQFSIETSTSFPFRFQQRVGFPPSSQQKGFSAMGIRLQLKTNTKWVQAECNTFDFENTVGGATHISPPQNLPEKCRFDS